MLQDVYLPDALSVCIVGSHLAPAVQEDGQAMALLV